MHAVVIAIVVDCFVTLFVPFPFIEFGLSVLVGDDDGDDDSVASEVVEHTPHRNGQTNFTD